MEAMSKKENLYVISLGCPKNLSDTEKILYHSFSNYHLTKHLSKADTVFINTCSFIHDAKEESIDTILEMVEWKKKHPQKKVIVTGCLWEQHQKELEKEIPEVDFFSNKDFFLKQNRILTTAPIAYLKIAEGCSRQCSFCTIPLFKGPHKSRSLENVLAEAKALEGKVHELILVSQDTSFYGQDLLGNSSLFYQLLERLADFNFPWIRILYFYPQNLTLEILKLIKSKPNICNYIDIPFQHLSNSVLKSMNRWGTFQDYQRIVDLIRENLDDSAIRSTFIIGYPTETQKDYEKLLEGLQKLNLDRAGFFKYSHEKEASSFKLNSLLDDHEIEKRFEQAVFISEEISEENLKKRIGKTYQAYIEEQDLDSGYYIARSQLEAPEIDGVLLVEPKKDLKIGQWISFIPKDADFHNLVGSAL